jgi:1-deoxy-D-xylulose-5-phosphate synthase
LSREGSLRGGFGQAVAEHLLSRQFGGKFRAFGLPDQFIEHGARAQLLKTVGLDADTLARDISALIAPPEATDEPRPGGGLFKRLVMRRNGDRKDRTENPQITLTGIDSE